MNRLLLTGAAGLLGSALWLGAAPEAFADGAAEAREEALEVEQAVRRMRAAAIKTTVLIRAVIPTGRTNMPGFGSGSGVLISESGEVLTCAHVVDMEGAQLTVRLSDGRSWPAKLVGKHSKHDYALIKIDAPNLPKLPVAALGNSGAVRRGDWAVAMGHPLRPNRDNQPTVSVGRVRSVSAKLQADRGRRLYKDVLMHDAPLFSGNSGGPLFDLQGRVVGVNAAITLNNENGYAVPIERIRRNLAALRGGADIEAALPPARSTRGGSLSGIRTAPIDEQAADYMRLEYGVGEFVATVLPGSTAARGGLKRLDVILEVNGEPLQTGQLRARLAQRAPGAKVALTVLRLRDGTGSGYHRVRLSVALDGRR
jgi:serine protease Do